MKIKNEHKKDQGRNMNTTSHECRCHWHGEYVCSTVSGDGKIPYLHRDMCAHCVHYGELVNEEWVWYRLEELQSGLRGLSLSSCQDQNKNESKDTSTEKLLMLNAWKDYANDTFATEDDIDPGFEAGWRGRDTEIARLKASYNDLVEHLVEALYQLKK